MEKEIVKRLNAVLNTMQHTYHFHCLNCGTRYTATANDKQWNTCPNCTESIT